AVLQLALPETLASDERPRAVANDRADVEARRGFFDAHALDRLPERPEDPDADAAACALFQKLDHALVLDLHVVDRQLLPGPGDELRERLARGLGSRRGSSAPACRAAGSRRPRTASRPLSRFARRASPPRSCGSCRCRAW